MDENDVRDLLEAVRTGATSADDAVARLRTLPFDVSDDLRLDHHRALRQGTAETVYGPGKRPDQVVDAVGRLLAASSAPVVVTRADVTQRDAAFSAHPGGTAVPGPAHRGEPSFTLVWRPAVPRSAKVLVCAAGTADLPVADECDAVLAASGICAERITDVGVAGLHRFLAVLDRVLDADVVVVVAGMEGALASVVGGVTGAPVIAVPTSVGYGAGLEGVTALLAMLSSCASGVTVVGIDNGYGAASAVQRLLRLVPAGDGA